MRGRETLVSAARFASGHFVGVGTGRSDLYLIRAHALSLIFLAGFAGRFAGLGRIGSLAAAASNRYDRQSDADDQVSQVALIQCPTRTWTCHSQLARWGPKSSSSWCRRPEH